MREVNFRSIITRKGPDEFSCLWTNLEHLSFACGKFVTIQRFVFMNSSWQNILTNHQQTVTNNTACHKFVNKPPTNENILSQLGAGPLQGFRRMFMSFRLSISWIELVINLQSICFTFATLAFVRTRPEKSQKKIIHRLFNVCDFQFFVRFIETFVCHLHKACHISFKNITQQFVSSLQQTCHKLLTSDNLSSRHFFS